VVIGSDLWEAQLPEAVVAKHVDVRKTVGPAVQQPLLLALLLVRTLSLSRGKGGRRGREGGREGEKVVGWNGEGREEGREGGGPSSRGTFSRVGS
jgi:hypothetical protein